MSILKVNTIQDKGGNAIISSDGSGTLTLPSDLKMTPAFRYVKSSNQTLTNNTYTKITFDTQIFDTDSAVSSSTFTVPTGKGGKYILGSSVWGNASGVTYYQYANTYYYLNGSTIKTMNILDFRNNPTYQNSLVTIDILDLSAGDTIDVYHRVSTLSGSPSILGDATQDKTYFYGYRIIGA